MSKKETAIKILNLVRKEDVSTEDMYNALSKIILPDKTKFTDSMVEFFKPVAEEFWAIHFRAYLSYVGFLFNENISHKKRDFYDKLFESLKK